VARKLSKGFMEEHLSHEIRVDIKIAVGGLDILMPHHPASP